MIAGLVGRDIVFAAHLKVFDRHDEKRPAPGPALALSAMAGMNIGFRQARAELHRPAQALSRPPI